MTSARLAALVLLVAPVVPVAAAPAPPRACSGSLSGAVSGRFGCLAEIVTKGERHYFVLRPKDPIDNVPTYQPGSFELLEAPAPGRYALAGLGMGLASVAAEGGTLFTAAKTSSERGEVELVLTSVRRSPKGAWIVHGTYRAQLLPAGAGKQGTVVVEARF